jgi:hypothetical protein
LNVRGVQTFEEKLHKFPKILTYYKLHDYEFILTHWYAKFGSSFTSVIGLGLLIFKRKDLNSNLNLSQDTLSITM